MVIVWGTGVLGLQHIFCWGNSSTYNWVLGLGFAVVFFCAYRAGRISWCCLPQLPPSLGNCTIGCHSGKVCLHWAECLASVIPALSRLRQKDLESQVRVDHIVDSQQHQSKQSETCPVPSCSPWVPDVTRDWGVSLSGNVCEGLEGLTMSQRLFRFLALFLSCHAVCLFQQSSLG